MSNNEEKPNTSKILYFYYEPAFFDGFTDPTLPSKPASQETMSQGLALKALAQELPVLQPSIKIWTKHPAELKFHSAPENPSHQTVDLTKTPSNKDITNDQTDQIEVDDHVNTNSGFTTIGPLFPHAYSAAGIYLKCKEQDEANFLASRPPDQIAIAERFSHDDVRRYHGFVGLQLDSQKHRGLWVIYHPGSASRGHGRVPRKLLVPEEAIFTKYSLAQSIQIEQSNSIYLQQNYALNEAALDVPKKPSGSSEPLIEVSEKSAPQPQGPNLNIIGAVATGEITKIKTKLEWPPSTRNYLQLIEGETLFDALQRYVYINRNNKPRLQFSSLDLIGHSRGRDNILKLGEFALTSRVMDDQCAKLAKESLLEELGISRIRLLGCRTACLARARRVVETIREYFPDIEVHAARADLFAVHYNAQGLRPEAEPLLADHDVITFAGPGDLPSGEDYPPDPPHDDDDGSTPPPTSPLPFEFAALSDPNAATVAAWSFLYWDGFEKSFDALTRLVHSKMPIPDKTLLRADCEVLATISTVATTIAGFRSFDIFLEPSLSGALPPRIRVYAADGTAYAFPFIKTNKDDICKELAHIGIDVQSAKQLPPGFKSWI